MIKKKNYYHINLIVEKNTIIIKTFLKEHSHNFSTMY